MSYDRFIIFMPFGMAFIFLNVWLMERQDPPEVRLRKQMRQNWMLHPAAKEFRDKHLKDIGYDLPDKKDEN